MDPDELYCKYYRENCSTTINNWVAGNELLSWIVNGFILMAAAALLWWVLWFCFWYLRRPFCVDCLEADNKTRTKHHDGDTALCRHHYDEREMAAEPIYNCPKHHVPFEKEKYEDVTVDRCPEGCIFLDAGEIEQIRASARASGQSVGMALGVAIS